MAKYLDETGLAHFWSIVKTETETRSKINNLRKFMKKGAYQFASVIAHQGTSTMAPGNTKVAYEIANRLGCDAFETDVQLTADGDFVCMHDFTVNSYCDLTGAASDYTLAQLTSTAITKGNYVSAYDTQYFLSFEDFIKLCKQYQKIAVVEIKTETISATLVQQVIDKIKALDYYEQTILIGTTYAETVREVDEVIPYMLVASTYSEELISWLASYSSGLALNYTAYTDEAYELCQQYGVPLDLWVFNSVGSTVFEDNYKCDFVTTDNILALSTISSASMADIAAMHTKGKANGFVAKTSFSRVMLDSGMLVAHRVNSASPYKIIPSENAITVPKKFRSENIMRISAPKIVDSPMRSHQVAFTEYNPYSAQIVDMGYMANFPSDFAYTYPLFVSNKAQTMYGFFYLQNMQQAVFVDDFYDYGNMTMEDTGLTLVYQPANAVFNSSRPAIRQTNYVGPNKLYDKPVVVMLREDVSGAYVGVSYYGFDADMKRVANAQFTLLTSSSPVILSIPSSCTYIQPFINVFQTDALTTQYAYISAPSTPWYQVLNVIEFIGA